MITPIKIGFDAKRAAINKTGLGNYSRFVLNGLSSILKDSVLYLLRPQGKTLSEYNQIIHKEEINQRETHQRERLSDNIKIEDISPSSLLWKTFPSLWRSFGITRTLKKHNISLYHGLSNELPIGISGSGIKSVVTIHDLIFLRYPQFYKKIDRWIYAKKFKYSCLNADKIIAVSECTKQDIIHFFGVEPNKIDVIYQGCASDFSNPPSDVEDIKTSLGLPNKFILFVGSIEERKNLFVVLKALKYIDQSIHLVAIGKRTPYTEMLENYAIDNSLSHRFHCLSNIPSTTHLNAIYHLASIFVYPSLYEGFGIPIIEAANAGLAVVAASGSCLEEAGGPDCIYISPFDEKLWGNSINNLLSNTEMQKNMVEKTKLYIQRFNQKELCSMIADLYLDLLGRNQS